MRPHTASIPCALGRVAPKSPASIDELRAMRAAAWHKQGIVVVPLETNGEIVGTLQYMAPEQLKKLSVVELSERVQVPEDNGKTKTAMKNEITALVRVKDGRAAVSRVLANGGPVEQIFTTVGKNLSVKYATSKDEKDQYNEKRFFTAADMDKNGKESDN